MTTSITPGSISKLSDFDVFFFSLLDIRTQNSGCRSDFKCNRKNITVWTLCLLSKLPALSIAVCWTMKPINFMIENMTSIKDLSLLEITYTLSVFIVRTRKFITEGTSSKSH